MYNILNSDGVQVGRKAVQLKRNIKQGKNNCQPGVYTYQDRRTKKPVFEVEYKMVKKGNYVVVVGEQFNIKKD